MTALPFSDNESQGQTLSILYRDEALVAVFKPADLLVHRSPIDKHETRFALQMVRNQIGQHVYPIHRLDRPTSGVLLFALSPEIAAAMGKQWEQKRVAKRYLAIVRGLVHGTGFIDYALKYKWDKYADADRTKQVPPQDAVSEYRAICHYELPWENRRHSTSRFTLVEMDPITGRKHQLRRHMVHIRHPIIGDTTHGDGTQNKNLRDKAGYRQLGLCCVEMGLTHPVTGKWLTITAPLDASTQALLASWEPYKIDINKR